MNRLVDVFVFGVPSTTNNKATRDAWKSAIRAQTAHLPGVQVPCRLRVVFQLSHEAFVTAPPYGSDLDNLLKPLMDALGDTLLRPLGDECVIELHATKRHAVDESSVGVAIEIEGLSEI